MSALLAGSSLKKEFGQMTVIKSLTKSSGTLERVWACYQASKVTWMIWRSWECAGLVPIVEGGVCKSCALNPDIVLGDACLQHEFTPNERSRGRQVSTGEYGLLNEEEFQILQAGCCPLCHQPRNDQTANALQANPE